MPSVQSIQHDHTYELSALLRDTQVVSSKTPNLTSEGNSSYLLTDHSFEVQTIVENLCLTNEQRLALEACTRQQNDCTWHQARQYRINGSTCGKILNQKSRTEALLRSCLYPKPFEYTPKQIAWGRENEPKARKAYVECMKSHGHTNLKAHASGFFVHSEKGRLGASPDARVSDPDATEVNGIAELKCPFSKADVPVEVACEDSLFYCSMTSSHGLRLTNITTKYSCNCTHLELLGVTFVCTLPRMSLSRESIQTLSGNKYPSLTLTFWIVCCQRLYVQRLLYL